MSDIVERLRAVSPDDYDECSAVMNDAATAIEGLSANMAYAARLLGEQTAKIERLEAALREVMVGGNHLAIIIGATHPQAGTHHAGALEFYGPGQQYDAWCCWNAIMAARTALEERT
jgi:hypothetical protein